MPLAVTLSEYVRACFTGIWIVSHEHQDALSEMAQLCQSEGWRLASWDIETGLQLAGHPVQEANTGDPLAAVRALPALATGDGTTLLVLQNFHPFLRSHEVMQAMARQILAGKQHRTFVIVLAPVLTLPIELEKLFIVLEHDLPDRPQLQAIAGGIATEADELPQGPDLERVLDAAAGMTRYEAEGAFSLALVRHGRLEPTTLWQLKEQTLLKSGLLTLHRGSETFAELGGLDSLKAFCLRALRPRPHAPHRVSARGVMLLGVPGTGKSAICKALGNETGRPTLILDPGTLMGSLVGQSEERTRQALKIIDAMHPAVLMIDEVDKALGGVASGNASDSGVSARMFGQLLTWLNDHESDVFVVCTANDVTRLPPEFSRSERFDGCFFLDLPSSEQRDKIWLQYLGHYGLDASQRRPDDQAFTGAEIKSCCRLAALLDVPLVQAAQNVVPVAITASESVERLRTWASGRCLSADTAGIYRRSEIAPAARRRVSRGPSNN